MPFSFSELLVGDVLLGLAAHMWFRKNEPKSVPTVVALLGAISVLKASLLVAHVQSWLYATFLTFTLILGTLFSSMVAYRLSPFHPLAKYPGPMCCKLTKIWGAYIAWSGKPHIYYKSLHDRYGPIVRIGPNELSIVDSSLLPSIFSMPKGPMWDGRRILPSKNYNKQHSLTSVRDLRRHAELRKPWDNAFKPDAIANYERFLVERAKQLMKKLEDFAISGTQNIDIALWTNYFTFDLMGDLAFGGVYSLMSNGDQEEALTKMKRGVFLPSITHNIPWILNILVSLPFVANDTLAFGRFGIAQAKKREAIVGSLMRKDLFHYLLENSKIPVMSKIVSSALLAIVAGSDTTAAVLANVCYYITKEPQYQRQLQAELDAAFPPLIPNESIDIGTLANLPYLNAILNEALRLQPPIATSLQRAPAAGSGGKALSNEIFIPEGTAVLVSPYVIQRRAEYFSPDPDRFWPDRWLKAGDPAVVVNKSAFIPFSTGSANCAGKPLAIIELRYVICLLARTFEMEFAKGYDESQWERDLVDRFVMLKGELPFKLTLRRKTD